MTFLAVLRRATLAAAALLAPLAAAAMLYAPMGPVIRGRRLDELIPFVQTTAFRGPLGAALAVLSLLLLALAVTALVRRRSIGRWAAVLSGALVLALSAPAAVSVLRPAEVGASAPPTTARATQLTIVAANTLGRNGSPAAVSDVVRRVRGDVLMLPEANQRAARRIRAGLPGGPAAWTITRRVNPGPDNAILVRSALRPLSLYVWLGQAYPISQARIEFGGRTVDLYTVHATAPRRGRSEQWARDLGLMRRLCRRPAVVAGDLNATVQHTPVRALEREGCRSMVGDVSGTWPSWAPRPLRARIDHVLSSVPGVRSVASGTAAVPGSDHGLVWARLALDPRSERPRADG